MEMRPNRVKHKLATGELALIIAGITDSDDIDVFGPNGFDGEWLEGEHGAVDAAEVGDLSRVCGLWGMPSIVRVNRNDQALIYRTHDAPSLAKQETLREFLATLSIPLAKGGNLLIGGITQRRTIRQRPD